MEIGKTHVVEDLVALSGVGAGRNRVARAAKSTEIREGGVDSFDCKMQRISDSRSSTR